MSVLRLLPRGPRLVTRVLGAILTVIAIYFAARWYYERQAATVDAIFEGAASDRAVPEPETRWVCLPMNPEGAV